jgi:hypothetical protein
VTEDALALGDSLNVLVIWVNGYPLSPKGRKDTVHRTCHSGKWPRERLEESGVVNRARVKNQETENVRLLRQGATIRTIGVERCQFGTFCGHS